MFHGRAFFRAELMTRLCNFRENFSRTPYFMVNPTGIEKKKERTKCEESTRRLLLLLSCVILLA